MARYEQHRRRAKLFAIGCRQPLGVAQRLCSTVAVIAMMVATMGSTCAQHTPRRSVPAPIDFATSQNDNLFSLVRSQDDIHALETAIAELTAGEDEAAVRRLHELLRINPRGVVPVAPGRYLGIRTAVVTVLANMSPKAVDVYEQLAMREGGTLLTRPLSALSPKQLATVAERFPCTKKGLAARLLLGDRALESGNGLVAARHFRTALDATAIASRNEQRVVERLACAVVLIEPATALAAKEAERLGTAGGDVLAILAPTVHLFGAIGGGRSGATPMDTPIGNPRPFWQQEVQAPGFDRNLKGLLAMFPVGNLDGIFVNTGRELIAFDPLRRQVQWVSPSPLRDFGSDDWDSDNSNSGNSNSRNWNNRGRPRRRGRQRSPDDTINQDMVLAAAVNHDVVVCALQVPDDGINVDFQASFRVISKIPQRRLFAFERQTGKLLWRHFDELGGPRTRRYRGHDSCAPPVIAGDTVYAPIQDRTGAIAFSIGAYDLQTGKLKWRRLVCSSQQDVNMFGNARAEYAASPIALHGGVIYGTTNLGVAYAIDALSGRLRWITAYDVVRMPQTRLHGQNDRQVYFANNAPVVVDGVVCVTPLDSQFALALDVDSGTILWRLPYDAEINGIENRVQWLCGALDDEFIFSGAGIVAAKARPQTNFGQTAVYRQMVAPRQLGQRRLGNLPGRAAITKDYIWVPTRDRLRAFDRAGNPHPTAPQITIPNYLPGNLMLVDGVITSIGNRNLHLILDSNALLSRSEQATRTAPNDPNALLRLATLRRALLTKASSEREHAAVQELYRRGLQACIDRGLPKSNPTRQSLQQELFQQALAIAERAAASASPNTLEQLATARDLAPDQAHWIEVHTRVLARCRANRELFLRELKRLEQHAPTASMPAPLRLTVVAFVLWQRAITHENNPTRAVGLWQTLLERYGAERIGSDPAASVAEKAIARLIATHGKSVYLAVQTRADEALRAAANDRDELHAITLRFPNSDAAKRAGLRLLDRAVQEGDLGVACGVLAHAIRSDSITAGILRRVQVAALQRGNQPLAITMATRLAQLTDAPSDWPADDGQSFSAAAQQAIASLTTASVVLPELPAFEVSRVPPRSSDEYIRVLPTRIGRGFERRPDTPLYVIAGSEFAAFDLTPGQQKTQLFAEPVEFLEHVLICGSTLIVPDTERVFAVDYRTGELRWELEFDQTHLIDCLGITNGILHVSAQPAIPDGNSELIGIEPTTGTRLFSRPLSESQLKPKPIETQLLVMTVAKDLVQVERLDAITGNTLAIVSCAKAIAPGLLHLPPDSLATSLYPQGITGDDDHIYLPVEGVNHDPMPQVIALNHQGDIAWHWRGTPGSQLLIAGRRGQNFVIAETSDQRSSYILLLDAKTGEELRRVDLGFRASILNWEDSWIDNPAPATIAIASRVSRKTKQRQLICFAVEPGPSFAVPLKPDEGDIERTPLFGKDFITFGVRPRRPGGSFRLYAIRLDNRRGAFAANAKARSVKSRNAPHGMAAAGPYTVLSTTQGLILLADRPNENR